MSECYLPTSYVEFTKDAIIRMLFMKRNTVIIDEGKGLWSVFFMLLAVFSIQKGLNQRDTVVHFVWVLRLCCELKGPKHEG
jgi:hypothetical protein